MTTQNPNEPGHSVTYDEFASALARAAVSMRYTAPEVMGHQWNDKVLPVIATAVNSGDEQIQKSLRDMQGKDFAEWLNWLRQFSPER